MLNPYAPFPGHLRSGSHHHSYGSYSYEQDPEGRDEFDDDLDFFGSLALTLPHAPNSQLPLPGGLPFGLDMSLVRSGSSSMWGADSVLDGSSMVHGADAVLQLPADVEEHMGRELDPMAGQLLSHESVAVLHADGNELGFLDTPQQRQQRLLQGPEPGIDVHSDGGAGASAAVAVALPEAAAARDAPSTSSEDEGGAIPWSMVLESEMAGARPRLNPVYR